MIRSRWRPPGPLSRMSRPATRRCASTLTRASARSPPDARAQAHSCPRPLAPSRDSHWQPLKPAPAPTEIEERLQPLLPADSRAHASTHARTHLYSMCIQAVDYADGARVDGSAGVLRALACVRGCVCVCVRLGVGVCVCACARVFVRALRPSPFSDRSHSFLTRRCHGTIGFERGSAFPPGDTAFIRSAVAQGSALGACSADGTSVIFIRSCRPSVFCWITCKVARKPRELAGGRRATARTLYCCGPIAVDVRRADDGAKGSRC